MNRDLMGFFQEIICIKKIKDGAYVINLHEYADVGTLWIALFGSGFDVEHVLEKIKEFIGHKNIKANIFQE